MSATFGVNYSISTEAARPISVQSSTPLAIVGTAAGLEDGLHFFSSVTQAYDALKSKAGTLRMAIQAVYDQSVNTPVILSVFDDKSDISKAKDAVEKLTRAEAETGFRPNIIIAPELSDNAPVRSAMIKAATDLNGTAIVDLDAADLPATKAIAEAINTKRVILCYPSVLAWDSLVENTDEDGKKTYGATVEVPVSGYIAGLICRTDAEREYGFSDSYSNRVINGISGVSKPVEFILGADCEADQIRAAGITTVIRYDGFRVWGGETAEKQEVIWSDLARVRTFDRIAEACQQGVFFAIDRKASQLYYAKRSVEELCRNLTGSQVLIGYDVKWNADKNTAATVTQGKFYLDIRMQNNPIVKTLELDFIYVDSYSDKLLADINN